MNMNRLSTGQIARILGVSTQSVIRWIDEGTLRGFRLPGKGGKPGRRYAMRSELEAFAAKYGIPLEQENGTDATPRIPGGPDSATVASRTAEDVDAASRDSR